MALADALRFRVVECHVHTGEPLLLLVGRGQHTSNTIETWLAALHTTRGLGRWYQIVVAAFGLVTAMFSVTGVYVWWKKRKIRRRRTLQSRHQAGT
ncbi:MAG: PepSY domain-containing protein [Vicinamibacterales bacterium]